jgi:hypothetical protein
MTIKLVLGGEGTGVRGNGSEKFEGGSLKIIDSRTSHF